jgi:hypothetical protein
MQVREIAEIWFTILTIPEDDQCRFPKMGGQQTAEKAAATGESLAIRQLHISSATGALGGW